MPTEDKLAKLLEKNIEASNRTTHAVRAFVRFLFIQLSFLTAAAVLWQLGLAFPDENNCTAFGCAPNGFMSAFVLLLVITGLIISSIAGWSELERSNMPEEAVKKSSPQPGSSVTLPNGTKLCPNCKRRYKDATYCADCDVWL
jgi:hypothetical protein